MSVVLSTGDIRSSLSFLSLNHAPNSELLFAADASLQRSASFAKKRSDYDDEVRRDCLDVTGKVFLGKDADPKLVRASLESLLQETGSPLVDTWIVSLPAGYRGDFKALWHEMELLAIEGKVQSIGVSDFGVEELDDLFSFAKVQPKVNQIALSAITPSLLTFSKQHGLDLLVHPSSDSSIDIDSLDLSSVLRKHPDISLSSSNSSKIDYAVRYDIAIRCRSLLAKKGYILGAQP